MIKKLLLFFAAITLLVVCLAKNFFHNIGMPTGKVFMQQIHIDNDTGRRVETTIYLAPGGNLYWEERTIKSDPK